MTGPRNEGLPLGSIVAVVGAGPCGLAAAIALAEAGFRPVVFDRGAVCQSIVAYPMYMTFHSTPERLSIGGMPFTIPGEKPTRREALAYYRSLIPHFGIEVRQYEPVESVEREAQSFHVRSRPIGGETRTTVVRALVVATGCFGAPNMLGVDGESRPHVSHVYREGHEAFQRYAVVVGGGNSAVESALDLFRAGAHVTLVHLEGGIDGGVKSWIRPDIENRIKRGDIAVRWHSRVRSIGPAHVHLETPEGPENLPAQHVYLLTGWRPDASLLTAMGVPIDEATGVPRYDATTMETAVPGVYLAGVLTAGKNANRVFIENGRDHGELLARAMSASRHG